MSKACGIQVCLVYLENLCVNSDEFSCVCTHRQAYIRRLNKIDPFCGFIYYFKTETLNTYGYFV